MWLAALLLALSSLVGTHAFIGKDTCKEMACSHGMNNLPNARWKGSWGSTKFLGTFGSVSECEAACVGYKDRWGRICKSFVWHDVIDQGKCFTKRQCFHSQCFASFDDEWDPVPQTGVISGKVRLGVASVVNKALNSLDIPSIEIPKVANVFGGEEQQPGDKKKAEEAKRREADKAKADELKRKEAARKAEETAKSTKAAEDKKRAEEAARSFKAAEDKKKAEESRRAEEAKRSAASHKADEAKKAEKKAEEDRKREGERREREEARRRNDAEVARRRKAQEEAKKRSSKKGGNKTSGNFGVEGLDLLMSASATRVSISVAILAILATFIGARHAATTRKHRQIEAELRSRGHITDDGSWLM